MSFPAVDVAAVVFTVRGKFARRHVLAEARRHLLETLRGREFTRGLDDYIAGRALADHGRQTTDPQTGRRAPAADQIFYTADFPEPAPWFIAGTGGKPPRESSRYERARVASLAVQGAIRAARTAPAGQADAPATKTSATARTDDQHHDQASAPPHAVDHPGRDAALTPAQQAAAVHAHQQAAMPEEYLGGRTTDAGTWLRTTKNLERLAAFTRAADARRRTYEDTKPPAAPDAPADGRRQEHEQQHQQPGHGQGPGPRP
ncbi:hypothetical protein ACFE3N_29495 (plasmid) [Streptomyces albidoflavus]|uniref:hypothetical protein n=1 Tax=Streptomyces TaxID=1883 RepID=UPI000A62A7FE|nr:hypothetical protein [Streptomyces sp. CNQ431]